MGNVSTKDLHAGRTRKNVHWRSAERPSSPGKPLLISDVEGGNVTLCWVPPRSDGGAPLTGYLVEQRITGSPLWLPTVPGMVTATEIIPQGLEPGRRYQFRVAAANAAGCSEFSEPSEPLTVTVGGAVCPPAFLAELLDATAAEGEKAEFETRVLGVPAPAMAWFKDGFEIFSSRRARITTEENRSVLTIHQTALNDEGEIKCTATNHAGHAVTRARLRVEAPPCVRLPRRYEEGLLFEAGEVMKLKVAVAGRPPPRITWTHDGETIASHGRVLIESGGLGIRISSVARCDRGEYRVQSVNPLGEDSASFLVTVTDKPRPPGRPVVTMSLGKSATLTWKEPEDDGGCKIGNYIVEYYRTGWDVWLKAAASRQLTATLGDLLEGSEYKFRVKAENPYGLSDPSPVSDGLFIPDPSRGITRVQEIKFPPPLDTPPVAPRRKRATTSASSSKSSLSEDKSVQTTTDNNNAKPPAQQKPVNETGMREVIKSDYFDRSSITRELSYGSPDTVYKKRLSANLNEESGEEEKSKSPSPLPNSKSPTRTISPSNLLRERSTPRENDDELQGSSEFMLVLYPDKNGSFSTNNQNTYDFEDDHGSPPMLSLSNPELGTQMPCMPAMRYAISSTELLYERAMARCYHAAGLEQKRQEEQYDKTSSEPRNLSAGVDLSRRGSLRRRPSGEQQKLLQLQERRLSWRQMDDSDGKTSPQPKTVIGVVFNGVVENPDTAAENLKPEIKEERISRDRSVEDDYTDSTASSDTESQDERFKMLFKKIKSLEDDEEDTYHPRSMQPTNIHPNSQAAEILTKPAPLPDPDFVPKPILKHQQVDNEIKPKTPPAKPERRSLIAKVQVDILPTIKVEPPEERKISSTADILRKRKLEARQNFEEENKVVIDYYSDIVNRVSTKKRQPEVEAVDTKHTNTKLESRLEEIQNRKEDKSSGKPRMTSQSPSRRQRNPSKDRKQTSDTPRNEAAKHVSRGNSRDRSNNRTVHKDVERNTAPKVRGRSESKSPNRINSDRINKPASIANERPRNTSRTRKRNESRSPTRSGKKQQIATIQNERWYDKTSDISKEVVEAKVRSAFAYLTDVAMFMFACWLYAFKDARLAIPVLALMLYRQIGEELQKRMPKWMTKKK